MKKEVVTRHTLLVQNNINGSLVLDLSFLGELLLVNNLNATVLEMVVIELHISPTSSPNLSPQSSP